MEEPRLDATRVGSKAVQIKGKELQKEVEWAEL